jgi:hypothetical protein
MLEMKNLNQIKIVESIISRLDQAEERISRIVEKIEKTLHLNGNKEINKHDHNFQELWDISRNQIQEIK